MTQIIHLLASRGQRLHQNMSLTLHVHLGMSRMADLAARIMVSRSSAVSRARPSGRPASKGFCTASCIRRTETVTKRRKSWVGM